MITGESIPVEKKVGDKVTGGTLNKNGYLQFKATNIGSHTVLANIVDMARWLSYYSYMLDLVEIGSSFDRIPNAFISKELVINLFSGIKNQLYNNR